MAGKMSPPNKELAAVWKYLKKADFVIFLIGLIIGFVAVHIAYFPAAGRIGELEAQVNDLEGEVVGLQNDLDDRATQIADLQSEVQNKSNQISALQSEISAHSSEISALESQISARDTTISELRSQIGGLEREIAARDGEISSLEQEIEGMELEMFMLRQRPELIGVYFSPKTGAGGGCEKEIIYWIDRATTRIHILMYSFTSSPIANALISARNRGVEVRVVFEEAQTGGVSQDDTLRAAGISVRTDTNSRNMHNKIMIVDGETLLTGSYDWSETAEIFNNENLIVIRSTSIGAIYEAEFSKIWNQSRA